LRRTRLQAWIVQLHARVGYHKTLVAIANKHARMIWAILAKGEDYDPDAWRRWSRTAASTPPAMCGVTP
jgi:transposase